MWRTLCGRVKERRSLPSGSLFNPTAAAWIGSLLVAGIVLILLSAEHRLGLRMGDHPRVARLSGWLVAVPLGIVALLGLLLGVLPRLSQRPWTIIGLATLALVAGLFRDDGDGWRRAVRWGVAMTLAVVLSLLAPRSVPVDLPSFLVDGSLINLRTLIVSLIIGLMVGIAGLHPGAEFLSASIALLLVAAGSAARPTVSRWNDKRGGLPIPPNEIGLRIDRTWQ